MMDEARSPQEVGEFAQYSVLVVEDTDDWLKMHIRGFKRLGANVLGVGSVDEAVEAFENGKFTHVVSDGLEGAFKDVVSAAQNAGVKDIFVVSGDFMLKKEVADVGAKFIDKTDVSLGEIGYEELLNLNE
jgi:CheY-like chemotaxis protein